MSAYALSFHSAKLKPGVVSFAIAGLLPVSSIALHCAGFLSLTNCLLFVIIPAFFVALVSSVNNRRLLKLVFRGWICGIVAVALYDVSRVPFILAGWEDFIPHIAAWLGGSDDHAYFIGYAWRYAGNGGGLGIVFFLLADYFGWRKYIVSNGVTYGLCVFASLVVLLIVFPESQEMMFKVTPLSFFGGLTGHIIYGFVLGKLYRVATRVK
ncbi:MAG TPA: hypothetical protein VK826_02070 [Bacteroidia bacterium]|nr:hypothetical protein [Bacteroidia bacterium]